MKPRFRNRKVAPEKINPHEFNTIEEMQALHVLPSTPQYFDQIAVNATTNQFDTLPSTHNPSIMLDIVRYSLLNMKQKTFFFSWKSKLVEREPTQSHSPVVDQSEISTITKRLYDELRTNGTLMVAKGNMRSLLFYAARYGDIKALRDILKKGGDVNVRDDMGKSPLIYAAIANHSSCVYALVSFGSITDLPDNNGFTAIHWAAFYGNVECTKALLYCNASIKSKNKYGQSPIHLATSVESTECLSAIVKHGRDVIDLIDDNQMTPLMISAEIGHEYCLAYLLGNGSDINKRGSNEMSAFHYLFKNRSTRNCSIMIRFQPSVMSHKDAFGRTLLHLVASEGNITMLQYLLEVGCNLTETDDTKKLPLHWAAVCGHSACITLLSEKKSDLNAKDEQGGTALHYSSQKNHIDCAIILIKRGADSDVGDSLGRTPLIWAALEGNNEMIRTLITYEADPNIADASGQTALHVLASLGNLEGISILLRKKSLILEIADSHIRTPLFFAIFKGRLDICTVLLNEGALFEIKDSKSNTPLQIAISLRHIDLAKLLLQRGADLNTLDVMGSSILHEACKYGDFYFMQHLFSFKPNLRVVNFDKQSLLHVAATFANFGALKALLLVGAEINAIDKHKRTPLDCALKANDIFCISLLRECGGSTIEALRVQSAVCIQRMYKTIENEKIVTIQRSFEHTTAKPVLKPSTSIESILLPHIRLYKKNIVKDSAAIVIQTAWRNFASRLDEVRENRRLVAIYERDASLESLVSSKILDINNSTRSSILLHRASQSCDELPSMYLLLLPFITSRSLNHSRHIASSRSSDRIRQETVFRRDLITIPSYASIDSMRRGTHPHRRQTSHGTINSIEESSENKYDEISFHTFERPSSSAPMLARLCNDIRRKDMHNRKSSADNHSE